MRMKPTPNVSFHMTFSIHFLYSPLMCRGGMGRKSSSNFLSSFLRLPKSEGRGRKEVFASSGRGGRQGAQPKAATKAPSSSSSSSSSSSFC